MAFLALLLISLPSCKKSPDGAEPATDQLKPQAAGIAIRDYDYIVKNPQTDIEILRIANTIVVKVPWRDIQPDEDGPVLRPNLIDNALSYVRNMNAQNPGLNMTLRVRVHCGVLSPAWVKARAGNFILYTDLAANATSPQDSMMPKFWQPEFLRAFAALQTKLATAYDSVPEIREIVDGGTGLFFAEAFIRNAGNAGVSKTNSINYINAGWTAEKDQAAIRSTIDAMKAWKKTRISMAFNEFVQINPPPDVTKVTPPTKDIIDYMVSVLGEQAILGNNGLRDENAQNNQDWSPGGLMYDISEYMKTKHISGGTAIYYQTATSDKLNSWSATLERGIQKGAGCIELPGPPHQFTQYLTLAQLKDFDQRIEKQALK